MKNVTLIGASGFVGTAILNELLARGHKVTAVVRNPEKLSVSSTDLNTVKADVADTDALANACKGKDAIISAYNPGWSNPNIYEETLRNYPLILEAAKKSGVNPDAIMGGVKSLGEFYLNTLMNEKDIDWVFFSPAGTLEPGKRTGQFRLGKDDLIVDENGNSHISVEDYAVAMVDELENPKHHYERFTIGY